MLRITPVYGSSSFLPDNVDNEANNNNVDVDDDNNDDPPEWLASPGPSCTLIEYAGCRLLLNVGWDESMLSSMVLDQTEEVNSSSVSATKKGRGDDDGDDDNYGNNNNLQSTTKLPQDIDAVLICDSTLSSLGGLPLFYGNHHINSSSSDGTKNHDAKEEEGSNSSKTTKRMKLQQQHQQNNPPFLATYPTVKMGQMTMYDHHASLSLDGRDPGYTLEDVDTVFNTDAFITLKYSQTVYLPLMHGTNKKKKKTDTTDAMDMDYNNNEQDEDDELTKVRTNKNNGAPHKNATLAITPQLSGLVVGGCYWTLRRLSDDAMIVLAPTYHHAKERHLSGCTIHKFGINADALITMPGGPRGLLGQLYTPPSTTSTTLQQQQRTTVSDDEGMIVTTKKKTKKEIYANLINRRGPGRGNKPILSPPVGNRSESELVDSIMAALRRDGNVLLPVDASGRVLELLLILDRHWDRNRLSDAYNLCWIGPMCPNVIEYARAQLEWMSPPLGAQFDSQRGHPYGLRNVHLCTSVSEMETLIGGSKGGGGETMSNPTCVLASGATLDNGPARDLLLRWGGNPDNLVLLTDSTRCVPRGDVLYSRRRRRRHQHPFGEGSSTAAAAMRENPTLVRAQSSMDNSIIETVDGGSGPTTVATDTDDTDGNDDGQSAKFIGPPLTPDLVSNYTTSSQLLYQWCAAKAANEEMPDEVLVDAYVPHRAPLRGVELQEFLAEEEREVRLKKAEMEHLTMMKEIELARGRLRLGVGDADETTTTSGTSNTATTSSTVAATTASATTTTTSSRPKKKSRFDQALFIKFSKPVHMTFDIREDAVGIGQPDSVAKFGIIESVRSGVFEDDYGIAVKADSFVDIVTGVDPSKFAGKSSGRIGEEVIRRGLGFGSDGKKNSPVDSMDGTSAELVSDDGEGGDEAINEKMLEVVDLSNGKGIIKGRNGRPPIKVSVVSRRLEVLAEIVYTPLEGRVDARAARQSVRALQPRHLVIIGGPRSNSLLLAEALRTTTISAPQSKGNSGKGSSMTHIPNNGQAVQLSVGHAAYKVRLIDTPYLTQEEKDELVEKEIESVEPYEAKIGDCTVSLVDFVATGKKWAVDGSIVLAPRRQQSTLNQPSLMISTKEVLLTDLRAEVTALGMKAEIFFEHSLMKVNGKIIVRKDTVTGKLYVEGPLCSDFYQVRRTVCSQYVTL